MSLYSLNVKPPCTMHGAERPVYIGSAEKDEYLMNNGVLAVKIGCFCGHIFRNYGFSKIEKDPK